MTTCLYLCTPGLHSVIFQAIKGKGYSNNWLNFESNPTKKQKLELDSFEEKNKIMQVNPSPIDRIFLRFPHLEKKICNVLEEKSLINFTSASRETVDIQNSMLPSPYMVVNKLFIWSQKNV